MYFQKIITPCLSIISYLIGDEKSKKCVVIDPTRNVVPYIIGSQNAELDIIAILETHVHADFVSGSVELKHQLNNKPLIYCSGMGGKEWLPAYADIAVENGTQIQIGTIKLEALHTPGHTPEHIIWICTDTTRSETTPWFAYTGDCVFVGSVGRPDLLGKEALHKLAPQLYTTLFQTLAPFPDFLEILPTHSGGSLCGKKLNARKTSTLGYERRFNPYFQQETQEEWIKKISDEATPTPEYFSYLKQYNLTGPKLLSQLKVEKWSSESIYKKDTHPPCPSLHELFLIDARHPELFAHSHIKESLNIPYSASFALWAGWMLHKTQPIGLIFECAQVYSEVVEEIRLMGFDQEIWLISLSEVITSQPNKIDSFRVISPEELSLQQAKSHSSYLLDVRTKEEWLEQHIPESHHIDLTTLKDHLNELPRNRPITTICRSGHRASLAASMLKKNGFQVVSNLRGGIQGWKMNLS